MMSWQRCFIYYLLLSLLTLASFAQAQQATLTDVRLAQDDKKTRLIFDLNQTFEYNLFTLDNPARLVIDFPNAALAAPTTLQGLKFSGTHLKALRSGVQKETDLRIVIDLSHTTVHKAFTLPAEGDYHHRLVVDFYFSGQPVVEKPIPPTLPKPEIKVSVRDKPLREVVVVIDAGHGGKDPGAIGPRGTREKDVVLKIAQTLEKTLQKEAGIRAVMTRTGDYYVPLRQRLEIARKNSADLFIALHADAFKDQRARGASVFALSQRGATSEAARWLASRENYSELGGVNLDGLDDSSGLVRSVLIDLSQTSTIGASLQLGADVLVHMKKIAHLHKNHVEQAPFVVLKSPDIPSILVETGFISNAREEANLSSPRYRRAMANAIALGVKNYLWSHAPQDTFIAQKSNGKTYTVARGDSLAAIASRYGVSASALKKKNKLSDDSLNIGQVLRIPN